MCVSLRPSRRGGDEPPRLILRVVILAVNLKVDDNDLILMAPEAIRTPEAALAWTKAQVRLVTGEDATE